MIGLNDSVEHAYRKAYAHWAVMPIFFYRNVQASGVIPQISAIMAPMRGAVYRRDD
jgi:acetyl-CoA carboxylase carboxyltransferase component